MFVSFFRQINENILRGHLFSLGFNKRCGPDSSHGFAAMFHNLDSLGSSHVEDNAAVPSPKWELF